MAFKSAPKLLPVRGRASGALEGVTGKRWRQVERVAQALRSLGDTPMTQARAERLAQRFGVHWATIYRYRARLQEADETTSVAGRTRGWKPLASRLSAKQEQGIEEAINALRKKPGPARVVDLVKEVNARCRLLRYSSHRQPFPIKLDTLRSYVGSKNFQKAGFKVKLRAALDELVKIGFLSDYAIDGDIVSVDRSATSLLQNGG